MDDATYSFISDVREKNSIKASASHKRTHCGKGGAVRLPSDNLSKKELKAMNGECKTYRMNDPMKWDEFNTMPNDLKIAYIQALRTKFGVPDCRIAAMFGIHKVTFSKIMRMLGISSGNTTQKNETKWNPSAWFAWVSGNPAADPVKEAPVVSEKVEQAVESSFVDDAEKGRASIEDIAPVSEPIQEEKRKEPRFATPKFGTMSIEGRTEECLNTIASLLGNANICLSISWEVRPEKVECENG